MYLERALLNGCWLYVNVVKGIEWREKIKPQHIERTLVFFVVCRLWFSDSLDT